MARWSSSASESVLKRGAAPGRLPSLPTLSPLPTCSWSAHPGLIAGCPWPRSALALLLGMPACVLSAWALAWAQAAWGYPGVVAVLLMLCAGVSLGVHFAWLPVGGHRLREPTTLHWWGPWPGERALPEAEIARSRGKRRLRRGSDHDGGGQPSGFTCGTTLTNVHPRLVLHWGARVCVDLPGHGWHWLQLGDAPPDRALKILLRSARASGNPKRARVSVPDAIGPAGGRGDAVASCEAWEAATARRQLANRQSRGGRKDAPSDTFPPTTIMHKAPGDPLEPSATHGPA